LGLAVTAALETQDFPEALMFRPVKRSLGCRELKLPQKDSRWARPVSAGVVVVFRVGRVHKPCGEWPFRYGAASVRETDGALTSEDRSPVRKRRTKQVSVFPYRRGRIADFGSAAVYRLPTEE
jgi:hypothetical protein